MRANIYCMEKDAFWKDIQDQLGGLERPDQIKLICETLSSKRKWDGRLCTLTADGRQFRVWNQLPCYFDATHVDGFGGASNPAGTIHIDGNPAVVQAYIGPIVETLGLEEVTLSNGVKVYLRVV